MKKYCFGIDVGGTTVKMGLFTTEGELLDKWEIPTRKEDGGAYILNDVAASVEAKLAEKNIAKEDVAGAGIGVPGPTLDTGYVSICVNLGWKDKNPANELSELLSIPVKAGNDANVAALGEMWKGGGEGYLEATCNCGNHGCLEQYASATGVVRIAKKLLAASKEESSLRTLETVTAKDVFDAAKAGDHLAVEAVEVLGKYLGLVVANVALTVDPDVFVIGGGVSKAGQVLIDVITKYYHKFAKIIGDNKAKVVLAKLGNDAGIYGAARMVLK